ncbi:MAG: hydroxymethylglutaryl-CoA synthase [Streptococcus sp.]|nr:hydroxymethylglutaryl-CoA synthase [Streptococcus sp.]
MNIGIDKIGFATSKYKLNMDDLAQSRQIDPNKYKEGLILNAISISPITEDIVTLGATAAREFLTEDDCQAIDMVIVATESGIDQSKAAAVYLHHLLGIQPFARSIEMKEACYSATASLDYAKLHIQRNPKSKVLVVASDIAKYGIESAGEPTQGAGSVAMLITNEPRIAIINDEIVAQTRDIMDFWRPNYSTTPYVNGIYSTKQYLDMLTSTWTEFQKRYDATLSDFSAFCFHLPFPKLAVKGLKKILKKEVSTEVTDRIQENFQHSIKYSQEIGNIYTASLFLGLLSLLENSPSLKANDKIALFSYGSGAVSEIFSISLVEGYEQYLSTNRFKKLEERITLSVNDYERIFFEEAKLDENGNADFKEYLTNTFYLSSIREHQRIYLEKS